VSFNAFEMKRIDRPPGDGFSRRAGLNKRLCFSVAGGRLFGLFLFRFLDFLFLTVVSLCHKDSVY